MELDLRGTNYETMKAYIQSLGGTERAEGSFVGDGWSVTLAPGVHRYRQWEFPRVVLTFEGDADAVADVVQRLRLMAMRGGA